MKIAPGERTFAFGTIGLLALLAGLGVCAFRGGSLFGDFAAAVAGIVATVAVKHGVESLATGTGIAGAWKTLTSEQKPEAKP